MKNNRNNNSIKYYDDNLNNNLSKSFNNGMIKTLAGTMVAAGLIVPNIDANATNVMNTNMDSVKKTIEVKKQNKVEEKVFNIQGKEVTIKDMMKNSFLPSDKYNQYVIDPNNVKSVSKLNNTGLSIQTNNVSTTLNTITENGINYIDTDRKSELQQEIRDLYKSYKDSNFDITKDDVNNKNRIETLNQETTILENELQQELQNVEKERDTYFSYKEKMIKSEDKISNLAKTKNIDLTSLFELKKDVFEKREKFYNPTTSYEDKNSLQKELNKLRESVYKEYKKLPREIIYEFNKYDDYLKNLEKINRNVENKEYNLINLMNEIQDNNQQKIDLATSENIVSYKNDQDFLDSMKDHIRFSETSKKEGDYVKFGNIEDGAGISFGTYQFTEQSGMLKKYLSTMAMEEQNPKIREQYFKFAQQCVKENVTNKNNETTKENVFKGDIDKLKSFLTKNADNDISRNVQDKLYNENYVQKAFELIDRYQILDKASIAHVVDHFLNTGRGGAEQMLAKCNGNFSPENIAEARHKSYIAIAASKEKKEVGSGNKFLEGWHTRVDNASNTLGEFSDTNELNKLKSGNLSFNKYMEDLKTPTNHNLSDNKHEITRSI